MWPGSTWWRNSSTLWRLEVTCQIRFLFFHFFSLISGIVLTVHSGMYPAPDTYTYATEKLSQFEFCSIIGTTRKRKNVSASWNDLKSNRLFYRQKISSCRILSQLLFYMFWHFRDQTVNKEKSFILGFLQESLLPVPLCLVVVVVVVLLLLLRILFLFSLRLLLYYFFFSF